MIPKVVARQILCLFAARCKCHEDAQHEPDVRVTTSHAEDTAAARGRCRNVTEAWGVSYEMVAVLQRRLSLMVKRDEQ